ncbi:MAG TPA: tetratricopeptide repeat protein, partial [Ktedonobacteraceae bacterium]
QAIIPIISVNPNLPWLNYQVFYRSTKPIDIEALEKGIYWIQPLNSRINELGGNLVLEKKYLPVVPLANLVAQVLHTANESARFSLAEFHLSKMYEAYGDEIDHETALFHANLSYQYQSEPKGIGTSNNLGYVFLGMDEFDKAEALFKRAILLSNSDKREADANLIFPGLAIYNLGVLHAEQGRLETALTDFRQCIDYIRDLSSEEREMGYLWVPVLNQETLVFEEHKSPDIVDAAETANAIMEHLVSLENNDE